MKDPNRLRWRARGGIADCEGKSPALRWTVSVHWSSISKTMNISLGGKVVEKVRTPVESIAENYERAKARAQELLPTWIEAARVECEKRRAADEAAAAFRAVQGRNREKLFAALRERGIEAQGDATIGVFLSDRQLAQLLGVELEVLHE